MRDAARARGAVVDPAGIRPSVSDESGEIDGGHRAVHRDDLRHADHQGDQGKGLAHFIRDLRKRERRDRQRSGIVQRQRVAVGGGLGDAVEADHPADAADVLDHHRLPEPLGHADGERAAEDVRRPARRKRHDQAYRLRRIALRKDRGRKNDGCEKNQLSKRSHRLPQLQRAVMPPSTTSSVPVMKRASSEARNSTAFAVSRPSPAKPSGMRFKREFKSASTLPPARWFASRASTIGVCSCPGTTVFTRMPFEAYCTATTRESWITAALVAAYATCAEPVQRKPEV